jgi:hypothetical protein
MQRNALFLTTVMLGGWACSADDASGQRFSAGSALGDTGDGSSANATETADSAASGAGDGDGDSGDGDSGVPNVDTGDGDSGDGNGDSGDGDSGDGDSGDGDSGDGDSGDGDGDGDGDTGDACVSVSQAADLMQLPADIIFVVDNSGSMTQEAESVQAELNGFSAQIQMSGIDHHVVLLSSYPDNGNGICVDPPLGSGSCPDADGNLPVYRHVDQRIGSHNALAKLISTQLQWKDSIRPDSVKHIVVVSDDESDTPAIAFHNQFLALDPNYASYVFHAIVCPWDCPESADIGQVYIDLVNQTGGVLGDLCQQEFQTVFDELANAVIAGVPLSCEFDIPAPPLGMNLDPDLVNVELDDGNNNLEQIPRVVDQADCMNHPEGWYYDDPNNPAQIVLCTQTCDKAQGYVMGAINVKFGCETLTPK